MRRMRWLAALLVVTFLGCGDSGPKLRGLGTLCTDTSQCESRLTCIDTSAHFVASDDAGCTAGGITGLKVCSLLCVSVEDCVAAGTAATCSFEGCAKVGTCLPVDTP